MHLLYLDDSGAVSNPADRHVVLAGVAVFERQVHWTAQALDAIAARVWPDNPQGLEFRGTDVLGGKKHWRGVEKAERLAVYKDVLAVVGRSRWLRVFGAAIHKQAVSPDEPMEYAFEQICNRFDRYLARLHKRGDTQRGLIVLDESAYETALQRLTTDFRTIGHRWGKLHNLCDVPLFVNSRATRMIQLADMIAFAIRRYYERGDATGFDIIAPCVDAQGGAIHGLTHRIPAGERCGCLACWRRPSQVDLPLPGTI
jgi:hypothetical protein